MSKKVNMEEFYVRNTSAYHATRNVDYPWDKNKFRENLEIKIVKYSDKDMEFDLIGINTALVNGFRRCLLSEIPCMAIEKVHMYNNTGVLQDEVLAHRLGLIPLKADARKFNFRKNDDEEFGEHDTLEFDLKVKYTNKPNYTASPEIINTSAVLSKNIKWVPIGDQSSQFKPDDVGPVFDDIMITKLSLGAEIECKLFAHKGIGKDHAKFQTVGTASYRLLPEIKLTEEIEGKRAELLKSCFSPSVIEIVEDKNGKRKATVASARYDSGSRNVFRYSDLKNCVEIDRVPNHFIFSIESIGAYKPDTLFTEAIRVLEDKCDRILKELKGFASED